MINRWAMATCFPVRLPPTEAIQAVMHVPTLLPSTAANANVKETALTLYNPINSATAALLLWMIAVNSVHVTTPQPTLS